ncbi:hypothetical protein [Alkalicoccobacillus porphyridii]|uniref:Uncharacterized protein n=1 Tax=Alkalicoccobacillus porphyridii TaxID=2597270 RepID=A0A553ZUC5_9BACI|nr:hypothetical protein [Alkalicoccobacillus porphyridii]TSB44925.1 hypothetical protein FN960_18945 [Alkalicoccobacillus porphyridii]
MNRFHVWIPLFFMVCLIGSISSEPTNIPDDHIAIPIQGEANNEKSPVTLDQDIQSQWFISKQKFEPATVISPGFHFHSDYLKELEVVVEVVEKEEEPVVRKEEKIPNEL